MRLADQICTKSLLSALVAQSLHGLITINDSNLGGV